MFYPVIGSPSTVSLTADDIGRRRRALLRAATETEIRSKVLQRGHLSKTLFLIRFPPPPLGYNEVLRFVPGDFFVVCTPGS